MLLLLLSQQIVDYRPTDLSVALTAYLSILLSLSFPSCSFWCAHLSPTSSSSATAAASFPDKNLCLNLRFVVDERSLLLLLLLSHYFSLVAFGKCRALLLPVCFLVCSWRKHSMTAALCRRLPLSPFPSLISISFLSSFPCPFLLRFSLLSMHRNVRPRKWQCSQC